MPLDDSPASQIRFDPAVPIGFMRDDPAHARRALGDVAAFGESLRLCGVLYPILLREDPQPDQVTLYTVVDGRRRKHASLHLGRETIPALIVPEGMDLRSPAVLQAVANMARLPLSPIETWRQVETLRANNAGEEAIAAALMLDGRAFRRLTLLGQLLEPMLDAMEASGTMPAPAALATMAAASADEQRAAWKRHGPKKPGQPVDWPAIVGALRRDRIPKNAALFGEDLAQKHRVTWLEDIFEQPENAWHTTQVARFLAAQREWLERVCIPSLRTHGYTVEILPVSPYGYAAPPPRAHQHHPGGTKAPWELGGIGKDWTRGLWIDPTTGRVGGKYYKVGAPAAAKKTAAAAPRPALPITRRGMVLIEEAKRRAAADAVMACTDPEQLLGVALLLLRDRAGYGAPSVAGVLDATGRLDVAARDFRGRSLAAAHALLGAMLGKRPLNAFETMPASQGTVERIGAGMDEVPVWEVTEQELALLKAPALKELAENLDVNARGTGRATRGALLMIRGQDGRLVLRPDQLAALGWAPVAPDEAEMGRGRDAVEEPEDEAELEGAE